MQKGINKVILVGNLGRDPEIRYMQSGAAVATLALATSESWRDKNTGEQREKTEWHRVALFGKLAEVAGEYLRKGSQVYIEGQLQTRKWQDQQSGQDRYTTEIVVQGYNGVMQILGSRSQTSGDSAPMGQGQWEQQQQNNAVRERGGFAPQQNALQKDVIQSKLQKYNQQYNQQCNQSLSDLDDDIPF